VDSKLPTVGVFAKATAADTPKAVVTKTDEAVRSISEEKAAKVKYYNTIRNEAFSLTIFSSFFSIFSQ
jgi:hypothetical protein